VWRIEAYRLSLFMSDLAWSDGRELLKHRTGQEVGDQLLRSTARISSCVIEGYSRCTSKDRARFYGYALGSARESRDWYYKGRHLLKPEVVAHRIELATKIIKLLIAMVANEQKAGRRISPRGGVDS